MVIVPSKTVQVINSFDKTQYIQLKSEHGANHALNKF